MTNKEYAVFALGVSVLGSFFGTALFYYIPDFWDPAPVWGIPISFAAALLTCLPVILFSRSHSALNRLGFCGSLLVVGYYLVMLIQDSSRVGSGILPAGLLNNLQITSSWAYSLYVLIPASLTVIASLAAGQLMLAFIHRFSDQRNNTTFKLNAKFLIAVLVTTSFTLFTLGCFTLIKSGPLYIDLSFNYSFPEDLREQTIQRIMENELGYLDAIGSMNLYFASADTDDDQLLTVLENLLLLKIEPEDGWKWGKFRRLLIKRLSELEHNFIGLELHVSPAQPTVALKPSYTFDTIEFVVHQDRLASLEIDATTFSDAATEKLRRYEGTQEDLSKIGVVVDKLYFPLSALGSFEARSIEVEVPNGLTARWVSERPEPTRPPEGLVIYIEEKRLSMYVIELSVIDNAIREHLTTNPTLTDIDALANIPIVQSSDEYVLRLGDIADIKQSYTNAKKQEGIDIPYEIRIR